MNIVYLSLFEKGSNISFFHQWFLTAQFSKFGYLMDSYLKSNHIKMRQLDFAIISAYKKTRIFSFINASFRLEVFPIQMKFSIIIVKFKWKRKAKAKAQLNI